MSCLEKKGFTLLEVMLAMVILSSICAGMLGVFVIGKRTIGTSGHRVQAFDFCRQTIESLRGSVGITGNTDLDAGTDKATDALTGPVKTLGGVRHYSVWDVDLDPNVDSDGDGDFNNDADYKRVTVRVHGWTEP